MEKWVDDLSALVQSVDKALGTFKISAYLNCTWYFYMQKSLISIEKRISWSRNMYFERESPDLASCVVHAAAGATDMRNACGVDNLSYSLTVRTTSLTSAITFTTHTCSFNFCCRSHICTVTVSISNTIRNIVLSLLVF